MTVREVLRPDNASHNMVEHSKGEHMARTAHCTNNVLREAECVACILVVSTEVHLDMLAL